MPLKKKKKKLARKKPQVKKRKPAKKPVKKVKKPVKKVKRPVKKVKKPVKKTPKVKEEAIGAVTHYFSNVRAAVIKLKAPLNLGDTIKIKGHTTDFTQTVTSIQIDRVPINSAKKGQEIGVLVDSRVREHDAVYKA